MSDKDQTLRKDAGKPRLELLPWETLPELAAVMAFGADKYTPHGWRQGMDWSRVLGPLARHLTKLMCGEDIDPETGCLHAAHVAVNAMFLVSYQLQALGADDRYKAVGLMRAYMRSAIAELEASK